MYFDNNLDKEAKRYYYEEHTCPTNYLRAEMVIEADTMDDDPHGIFEFVDVFPDNDYDEKSLFDEVRKRIINK